MPRTCTICRHEQHQAIDQALIAGEPFRRIAAHFETSEAALRRHKKHLSHQIVKAAERREDRHADSLIDQVDALAARTRALLDEVFPEQRQNGQKISPRDVAAAVREVRETLRLTAQLTGQLKGDGATVNVGVFASPAWNEVITTITGALDPYPAARTAVVERLAVLARNGTGV